MKASVPRAARARVLAGWVLRSRMAARQKVTVMTVDRTTEVAVPTSTA